MANKHSKTEERIVKENKSLDTKKRDRGDSLKKQDSIKNTSKVNDRTLANITRKQVSDSGDVASYKTTKVQNNKEKPHERSRTVNELRTTLVASTFPNTDTVVDKTSNNKASIVNTAVNRLKIGERKPIGDKVQTKSKLSNPSKDTKCSVKSDLKSDILKTQSSLKSDSREMFASSLKTESVRTGQNMSKKEKEAPMNRKPMIKTVKSKHENRLYKAVTFTEQTRVKPTVLEINIPNVQAKKTKTKLIDKNLEVELPIQVSNNQSTNNVHRAHRYRRNDRTKRKKLNRCISSPDKFKKMESPPTEVAKWAPSCINAYTKPYYEAWVNTTLAAINHVSKKDKLYVEKQNIIQAFQKSLRERVNSPELVHADYHNEFYAGTIKINHKNASKNTRQTNNAVVR